MDDFSLYGDSFEDCLPNIRKVLTCQDKHSTLNWDKCPIIVERGIVLGYIISSEGIDADKAKVDLIINLPLPTCVNDIRVFLRHAVSTRDLSRTLARLLSTDPHSQLRIRHATSPRSVNWRL